MSTASLSTASWPHKLQLLRLLYFVWLGGGILGGPMLVIDELNIWSLAQFIFMVWRKPGNQICEQGVCSNALEAHVLEPRESNNNPSMDVPVLIPDTS